MQKTEIHQLVRPNILKMKAYSSARSEFKGEADILLDANENPYDTGFNRYPDPLQWTLKHKIAELKGLPSEQIFLGNGSDEAIDLLIRIFCEPGKDHILTLPPTYGMYKVCADIADVGIVETPLAENFQIEVDQVLAKANATSKILFICSPNNPTGNSMALGSIKKILQNFQGIVVIDEAYIDFSEQESASSLLGEFERLVVLQTFSKAWGLAGIRLGMAFASEAIIALFNKVKAPYNVNQLTQDAIYMALDEVEEKNDWVSAILTERKRLEEELSKLKCVLAIHPSDTNFLLVKVSNPPAIYQHLINQGIVIRDRSKLMLCEDCLRITVGNEDENGFLLEALEEYDFIEPKDSEG